MTTEPDNGFPDTPRAFAEHLTELRGVLIRAVAVFVVSFVLAVPAAPLVLDVLRRPAVQAGLDVGEFLPPITVLGGMTVALSVIFWSALLFSTPLIVFFAWRFVDPALNARERRAVRRIAGFASVLFFVGVAFCYYVTLPIGLRMILGMNRWLGIETPFWTLESYVSFTLKLCLAFGLASELPVVVLALGFMGILSSRFLREKRRHAIVGILILSMLLTPPDPYTMLLMGVPLIVLYEVCIWILRAREKRTHEEERNCDH